MDILAAPAPKNVTELRISPCLAGYYRRLTRNFIESPAMLHAVTSVMESFKLTEEMQEASEDLNKKRTTPPVLAFTDVDPPFSVQTDAYSVAL